MQRTVRGTRHVTVLDRDSFFSGLASFNAEDSEGTEACGELRGSDDARFSRFRGLFFARHGKVRL